MSSLSWEILAKRMDITSYFGFIRPNSIGLKSGQDCTVREDVELFGGEGCSLFVFHHVIGCGVVFQFVCPERTLQFIERLISCPEGTEFIPQLVYSRCP